MVWIDKILIFIEIELELLFQLSIKPGIVEFGMFGFFLVEITSSLNYHREDLLVSKFPLPLVECVLNFNPNLFGVTSSGSHSDGKSLHQHQLSVRTSTWFDQKIHLGCNFSECLFTLIHFLGETVTYQYQLVIGSIIIFSE